MPETVPTYLAEHFIREQASYDGFERFDLYDAVTPVKNTFELEPIQNKTDINEAAGTASYQGSTLADKGVSWKSMFKVKPRAPSGLDVDLHQYADGVGDVHVRCFDLSDGPGYDDLKAASSLTAWANNYQLLPDAASEAIGDGFMVGLTKQFSRIEFNDLQTGNGAFATWGAAGSKYQYSTGAGTWSDLTVVDTTDNTNGDGTTTLEQVGTITFTIPEDWVRATYDGQEAFWVRCVLTAVQLTQTPIIDDTAKDEPFVISVDQMGPDIRMLLKAAMGWESVVGITSIVYKLSDLNTPDGLQAQQHEEGYLQENGSGLMVTEMTLKAVQGEDPTFEFAGDGARYGRFAKDVVGAGGIATGVAVCPLNDASRGAAIEPAVCQLGDDFATAGYLVTAHDDTSASGDFTISPVLAGAGEAADEVVKPYAPARSVGGTVLAGINHALTIDGVTLGFRELTVKMTTQWELLKEAISDRAAGILRAKERVIEFEVAGYYKTGALGNAPMSGRAFDNPSHDIDVTIGATSGLRLKASIPAGEGRVNKLEHPENEVVMVTIIGRAKQASVAGDEFVLSFD